MPQHDLILVLKACVLGFMVAIPVGPVAVLLVQRSLSVGSLAGLFTGLGAALADAFFGYMAALGLVALVEQLEVGSVFWRPLGSLALIIVALHFIFQKPPKLEAEEVLSRGYQRRYWWDLVSSFFLTLINPTTIIAFAALFAGSDLIPEDPKRIQYFEIAAGIFSGSLIWWIILVAIAKPVKRMMSPEKVHRMMQAIGGVLISLALLSLVPRVGDVIDKVQRLIRM